jgi:hypothetical protein
MRMPPFVPSRYADNVGASSSPSEYVVGDMKDSVHHGFRFPACFGHQGFIKQHAGRVIELSDVVTHTGVSGEAVFANKGCSIIGKRRAAALTGSNACRVNQLASIRAASSGGIAQARGSG